MLEKPGPSHGEGLLGPVAPGQGCYSQDPVGRIVIHGHGPLVHLLECALPKDLARLSLSGDAATVQKQYTVCEGGRPGRGGG